MTKYKEYFNRMIEANKELFDEFKQVHDRYGLEEDPSTSLGASKLQAEFNKVGAKVQLVIREWEDKLCGRSEGSGYASYSGGLAQKFQDEIRAHFPFIDNVGIIRETPGTATEEPLFNLKKINL